MSLRVQNLTKTFDGKVAVDDISFEMAEPGVFGLIGTNGAGKTTTIRMILGIMPPDIGSSYWDDKIITREMNFRIYARGRGIYENYCPGTVDIFWCAQGDEKARSKRISPIINGPPWSNRI